MASITLRTPHDSGVTVTVYPGSNWNSWLRPPTGAPVGSSTTSGITGADGSVTLTGLADGTEYYAHTNVGGHRYIGFRTDATAASAGSGVSYAPVRLKSGYWYADPVAPTTGAGGANNELVAAPWPVGVGGTLDRIALETTVNGEAGSLIHLGIYSDDGNGYPGARLLNAGTIPGDGTPAVKEITISQLIPAGLYWRAALWTNAPTTRPTIRRNNGWLPFVPVSSAATASSSSAQSGLLATGQTSLPATFPAGAASTAQSARVLVRAA